MLVHVDDGGFPVKEEVEDMENTEDISESEQSKSESERSESESE